MRVSTESRAVVTLDVTGPGDVLGEMALGLTSHRRSATVVALDECSTRMLTVAAFSALCLEHPGVAQATTQLLPERVDRLASWSKPSTSASTAERLAASGRSQRISGALSSARKSR